MNSFSILSAVKAPIKRVLSFPLKTKLCSEHQQSVANSGSVHSDCSDRVSVSCACEILQTSSISSPHQVLLLANKKDLDHLREVRGESEGEF